MSINYRVANYRIATKPRAPQTLLKRPNCESGYACGYGCIARSKACNNRITNEFSRRSAKWLETHKAAVEELSRSGKRREWIDHAPGLPESTYKAHFNSDGTPKAEREPLHDALYSEFLDHVKPVAPNKRPVAVLMMGLPASGKSTVVSGLGINQDSFVQVDPDAIKQRIPEYQKGVDQSARDAAWMAHQESVYVSDNIRDEAIETRRNLIIDGTGSHLPTYLETAARLKEKGYRVQLVMPHVEADTAVERVAARAEKEGRYVPADIIIGASQKVPGNFLQIKELADDFTLLDASKFPPTPVWRSVGGKEQRLDPGFVERFESTHALYRESRN